MKRTPDTKNYTVEKAIQSLKKVDLTIKKNHRYPCGLERLEETFDGKGGLRGFFSSPDYQNGELYYALVEDGWHNAGYNAPYHWIVGRGKILIYYTEGDIYIRQLQPLATDI